MRISPLSYNQTNKNSRINFEATFWLKEANSIVPKSMVEELLPENLHFFSNIISRYKDEIGNQNIEKINGILSTKMNGNIEDLIIDNSELAQIRPLLTQISQFSRSILVMLKHPNSLEIQAGCTPFKSYPFRSIMIENSGKISINK